MRVALVHYHLLRGGVSSVLRRQARVLRDAGIEVLVLSGEVDQDSSSEYAGSPLIIVPELNYDSRQTSPAADAETLARSISAAIEGHWSSKADLIHIHNPLIRKNALFIPALRLLVAQGQKLLLQNHDFAEDFRPDVYVSSSLYPENCHYAAINGRDFSFLRRAGLELDGVHLLPNAVSPLHATEGLERTRYLYPVRAIRRKNIGEALLLSLFLPPNRTIAITLPPTSSRDEKVYLHWKDLAKRMSLPVGIRSRGFC
ncbi:hypothetical protein MASR2M78_28610 [Treponema sp.]